MISIDTIGVDRRSKAFKYDKYVDQCPFCHSVIEPIILNAYINNNIDEVRKDTLSWVIFKCPKNGCGKIFIGVYYYISDEFRGQTFKFLDYFPVFPTNKEFSTEIIDISPDFVNIYNQASSAEQYNLQLIVGPGYRKSLEFLIKDYALTKSDESKKEEILKKPLAEVIKSFIDDPRIKSMAQRAVWLGNDETHYLRKWEGKDIAELKTLIELTVKWIEMVVLSDKYVKDMPDN